MTIKRGADGKWRLYIHDVAVAMSSNLPILERKFPTAKVIRD